MNINVPCSPAAGGLWVWQRESRKQNAEFRIQNADVPKGRRGPEFACQKRQCADSAWPEVSPDFAGLMSGHFSNQVCETAGAGVDIKVCARRMPHVSAKGDKCPIGKHLV